MYSTPHPSSPTTRRPKTRKKARVLPSYVRAALALLRRFAEREPGRHQREAVTAWVDHLAHMLEHPYGLTSAEQFERERERKAQLRRRAA